jgi:AGCS family alanine or glycine:cation symporter
MYVIREGLGRGWTPLAYFFCAAGLIGTLPVFQINQLTQAVREVIFEPREWVGEDHLRFDLTFGIAMAIFVACVIFGGIKRIGAVAARLVPFIVLSYVLMVIYVLVIHADKIPANLSLIVTDAFSGRAVAGGLLAVMITGVRRGAFSNEAGIGTESMAHGAAKTGEPVREGLVAMMGPVIDTLIVCSCTALAILMTGSWQRQDIDGVTLTVEAFATAMPGSSGAFLLTLIVVFLSLSTMFTYWYYGAKCLGFLIGAERQHWYKYFYTVLIVGGAVVSLETVISLIDGFFALMAVPTLISTFILAPKVMVAARDYVRRYRKTMKVA